MTTKLEKIIYTAHAHVTGGREGRAVSDDGLLDVKLSPPKAMGGAGTATNPEQLFAAGYSACFMGAMKHVAGMKKISIPADASIDASIDIGPIPAASVSPQSWSSTCQVSTVLLQRIWSMLRTWSARIPTPPAATSTWNW